MTAKDRADRLHGVLELVTAERDEARIALRRCRDARAPLDVPRVALAVRNVAARHGIKADPAIPFSVARIWGYSAAPLTMDAEIAAEYARLEGGPHDR